MITRERVSQVVLGFLQKVNSESDLDLEASEATVIMGDESLFDSMKFLDFVGLIEDWIDEEFNIFLDIGSKDEDFKPEGPFANVGCLIDSLTILIEENNSNESCHQ